MSELDHLRKKPPDDEGLLLHTKDRRLKRECQECGVKFFIGPEETSQQASKRRAALRRSINAAKKKRQRVAEKGGEREQVRLQKQALRQDRLRQTETEDARTSGDLTRAIDDDESFCEDQMLFSTEVCHFWGS